MAPAPPVREVVAPIVTLPKVTESRLEGGQGLVTQMRTPLDRIKLGDIVEVLNSLDFIATSHRSDSQAYELIYMLDPVSPDSTMIVTIRGIGSGPNSDIRDFRAHCMGHHGFAKVQELKITMAKIASAIVASEKESPMASKWILDHWNEDLSAEEQLFDGTPLQLLRRGDDQSVLLDILKTGTS